MVILARLFLKVDAYGQGPSGVLHVTGAQTKPERRRRSLSSVERYAYLLVDTTIEHRTATVAHQRAWFRSQRRLLALDAACFARAGACRRAPRRDPPRAASRPEGKPGCQRVKNSSGVSKYCRYLGGSPLAHRDHQQHRVSALPGWLRVGC